MANINAALKKGDSFPYIRVQFGEGATPAAYVPWTIPTGSVVYVCIVGAEGLTYAGKELCVIEDAALGIVYYDRAGDEKLVAGEYLYEFEVTLPSGAIRTFPSDGYIHVTMLPDNG